MAQRAPARSVSMVVLAAAVLALAIVVSTVATSSVLGGPSRPGARSRPPTGPARPLHRDTFTAPAVPGWVATVVLLVLVLAIVVLVVCAKGARRPVEERLRYEADESVTDGDWVARVAAEIARAAAEQLAGALDGDARNAIVACWMRLQDATTSAGLPAEPTETSQEFTLRVLRHLRLDEDAITTLATLYREARFSEHQMLESQRDQAVHALGLVAEQLTVRRPRLANTTPATRALDSVAR